MEKHNSTAHFDIEHNGLKAVGDDTLLFSKPVTITDNSEMWSGTKYDIPSLDIANYSGKLTADHFDSIETVLGTVLNVRKVANRKVTIDGVKFAAKENPLADYAKRMMQAGFLTDFSIETVGPWPDDDGVFHNAKLVGLSLVVTGNNKQAHINKIAEDTLESARSHGVDVTRFCQALQLPLDKANSTTDNLDMKFKTIKNTRGFAVLIKYLNAAGDETEVTVAPNKSVDIPDTDGNKDVVTQIDDAQEPVVTPDDTEEDEEAEDEETLSASSVTKAVAAALKPLNDKLTTIEKTVFDNGAQEPEFKKIGTQKVINELTSMDYRDRHGKQINYAWSMLKDRDMDAAKHLSDINKFHVDELKKAGKVNNAVTIADFGNFVISPELLSDIEGFRSNFQPLISRLNFRDTLSLQMAWLSRSGDINMQEVEMCDDDADGNLKPISEYTATIETSNLQELAAVTPVCNAATRFLAADLLGDVAQGYRTDFDRKRAQLFIARLQQAVNESGLTVPYATGATGGSDVNAMKSFFGAAGAMQEDVMNGVFILSQASYWELMGRSAGAGINTDSGFGIFSRGENGSLMVGSPFIVVPNELLPKLGSNQTKTFVVDGANVTITTAVFYVDLSTFSGRTSGGLSYDLSTEAAYEDNGVVKSAYQRNELVLRGSFFRGGAVRDIDKVVGMNRVNVS